MLDTKYRIPCDERCGRRGAMYPIHSERSAGEGLGGRFSHIGWLIEFNSRCHGTCSSANPEARAGKNPVQPDENHITALCHHFPWRRLFFFFNRYSFAQWVFFPRFFPRISVDISAGAPAKPNRVPPGVRSSHRQWYHCHAIQCSLPVRGKEVVTPPGLRKGAGKRAMGCSRKRVRPCVLRGSFRLPRSSPGPAQVLPAFIKPLLPLSPTFSSSLLSHFTFHQSSANNIFHSSTGKQS
ncbi:hypothetical protein V8C42DRAFT_12108 [Trichoderma barbatum]